MDDIIYETRVLITIVLDGKSYDYQDVVFLSEETEKNDIIEFQYGMSLIQAKVLWSEARAVRKIISKKSEE